MFLVKSDAFLLKAMFLSDSKPEIQPVRFLKNWIQMPSIKGFGASITRDLASGVPSPSRFTLYASRSATPTISTCNHLDEHISSFDTYQTAYFSNISPPIYLNSYLAAWFSPRSGAPTKMSTSITSDHCGRTPFNSPTRSPPLAWPLRLDLSFDLSLLPTRSLLQYNSDEDPFVDKAPARDSNRVDPFSRLPCYPPSSRRHRTSDRIVGLDPVNFPSSPCVPRIARHGIFVPSI